MWTLRTVSRRFFGSEGETGEESRRMAGKRKPRNRALLAVLTRSVSGAWALDPARTLVGLSQGALGQ